MNAGPTPVTRVARVRRWWGQRGVLASVVATTAPSLVLTFDDGPDPANTPRVLEVLRDRGASATFFVLMTRVRREPRLLAELVAAGHEVALHGPDHRALTQFTGREVCRRTEDARRELEDVTGTAVRWFRPPYGAQTPATWLGVRRAGLVPVLWSATTWDWKPGVTDEQRLAKALESSAPGAILLAHDGVADGSDGVDDGPAPAVARAALVGRVLVAMSERGVGAVSLSSALMEGGVVRSAEFRLR